MEEADNFKVTYTGVSNSNIANITYDELENIFERLNKSESDIFQDHLDILQDKRLRIAVITVYSVVILLGLILNATVMWVFIRNKRLHTPTNIFILVLAGSDVLLCTFNLPLQLHHQLTRQWLFGETMCKIIVPTYGIPVYMSSMAILMIAIYRYGLIVHPHHRPMSNKTAVLLVIVLAAFSILLTIPVMIQMEYMDIDLPVLNIHMQVCIERWKSTELRQAYTVSTVVIQFFVPLFVTTFLHVQIGQALNRRKLKNDEKQRNRKTNHILIAIVITFSVCWLPWNSLTILLEFRPKLISRYFSIVDCAFKILAMASVCINPFLYGWLNSNFRTFITGNKERGSLTK